MTSYETGIKRTHRKGRSAIQLHGVLGRSCFGRLNCPRLMSLAITTWMFNWSPIVEEMKESEP
ncbi:hypothetical protein M6B38_270640 [Iris pallida]|uniref:Uncharacterized protein n=1 Tax=Iris pallida TaxID=29817 RepID=A0AAX6I7Y8_IRIPA|nr:hypothetical protein M6B38_270640 [Iris pallida]